MTCHAPGCREAVLCDAHVIPRGFARTLSKPGDHNKAIRWTGSKPAKQPHGEFDPGILCGPCDEVLGRFDQYAVEFCASLPATGPAEASQVFQHQPFDGPRFARATLAILWRASISRRDQFADINLGPYSDRAAAVLFNAAPLSTIPEFEVVLNRYASADHDTRKFVFMPLRIRSGAINAFTIGFGGFLVWAKFDRRPTDRTLAPFVINGATRLLAPIVRFEDTAEYAFFMEAACQDRRRNSDARQAPNFR